MPDKGASTVTGAFDEVDFAVDGAKRFGLLRVVDPDMPTVVLLSGVGFHTFEYVAFAELLADRGINTYSFDFRGHGRSDGTRGAWTINDLVQDTQAALDALEDRRHRRVTLFGNSLGAMVAIATAGVDDRPDSVVASNAAARLGDFLLTPWRRVLFAAVKPMARVVPLRISLNHFYSYEQLINDSAWIDTIRHDPLVSDARRLTVPTYRDLLEDWNGETSIGLLRCPVLVVHGELDKFQPSNQAEMLFAAAHQPKQRLALQSGHLPHLERPTEVADHLAAWVFGLPDRPGIAELA
jgi:pimeloyl-ACP methyl ester carboxylesterase